jgi:hypothetical protein
MESIGRKLTRIPAPRGSCAVHPRQSGLMNMIAEHALATLSKDFPEWGLHAGDGGSVVHVHDQGKAYENEFIDVRGITVAVLAVDAADLREVSRDERPIPHLRTA